MHQCIATTMLFIAIADEIINFGDTGDIMYASLANEDYWSISYESIGFGGSTQWNSLFDVIVDSGTSLLAIPNIVVNDLHNVFEVSTVGSSRMAALAAG